MRRVVIELATKTVGEGEWFSATVAIRQRLTGRGLYFQSSWMPTPLSAMRQLLEIITREDSRVEQCRRLDAVADLSTIIVNMCQPQRGGE